MTYWDTLTPLSYKHCIEGVRPDVSLRAYDDGGARHVRPVDAPLDEIAKERPVYALMSSTTNGWPRTPA